MNKKLLLCMVGALCATMVYAQFEQMQGQRPQRESAEVRATRKTQMLRDSLHLSPEQFNSVYKVYYNEYAAMEQSMSQSVPPMGGGPGSGPGGGGPGGGGMPPQGFGGGMPPQGFDGDMPAVPSTPKELTEEQLQKQQTKRQKKMQKILTEEQYTRWLILDAKRDQRPPREQSQSPTEQLQFPTEL